VKFTVLCTAYYVLPLALTITCSYLSRSLIFNHCPQEYVRAIIVGFLVALNVFLTFNLPQSPIRRWVIGMLVQEHRWKWDASLLIFLPVVVLLLILFHLTISLLSCHVNVHDGCNFEVSKEVLVIWLFFVFITGGNFVLFLYITNTSVRSRT